MPGYVIFETLSGAASRSAEDGCIFSDKPGFPSKETLEK